MQNLMGTLFTITVSVIALLMGLIYLVRPKFMKYHEKAVQKDWKELAPEMQTLILALMRAVSGGFLSFAIAIFILQLKYNRDQLPWIPLTILIIGTIFTLGILYATLLVRTKTKGRPPVFVVLLSFILLLAGYFFN